MQPEEQQRIMGYFIEEAKDHLNTIEQGLLNLQATIDDAEKANEIFRAAHSVKGGAAMLGLESIQKTAHRMEDYFKVLKESPVQVDRSLETMFLRISDGLKDLLEQLEGPFGLTQDKAQEIMADVEPVFGQIESHLVSLVNKPNEGIEIATAERVPASSSEAAKNRFRRDGASFLRKMLAAFKQPDNADSRQSIQDICAQLYEMGEQFNLSAWCDLVETARLAAANKQNDYRALAPVLIREIKQAQDLILADRASEVSVSDEMQALLPEDLMEEESISNGSDGIDSFDLESSLEDSLHGLDFASAELLEDDSVEDFGQLFGAEEARTGETAEERIANEDESSQLEDLFGDEDLGVAAENNEIENSASEDTSSTSENDIERLSLNLDFDEIPSELSTLNRNADSQEKADESLDALLATVNVTGPEVGQDELDSLADLFDGDLEELDNTLGGHAFATEEMQLHPEKIDLSPEDDLKDLLSSDAAEGPLTQADDELEDDLFGGTLTDGEFVIADDTDLDSLDDLSIDNLQIDDSVSIGSDLSDDLINLSQDPWAEDEPEETTQINTEDAELDTVADIESLGANELDNLFLEENIGDLSPSSEDKIAVKTEKVSVVPQIRPSHTVSPKEEEIEFPTLTGEKLQEAEEDIDSFFLDEDLRESEDELSEQLPGNPWGELAAETEALEESIAEADFVHSEKPDKTEQEKEDIETFTFNLADSDADTEKAENGDLETDFLQAKSSAPFDVDLDIEQAGADLDDLLNEEGASGDNALLSDSAAADDIWDELISEPSQEENSPSLNNALLGTDFPNVEEVGTTYNSPDKADLELALLNNTDTERESPALPSMDSGDEQGCEIGEDPEFSGAGTNSEALAETQLSNLTEIEAASEDFDFDKLSLNEEEASTKLDSEIIESTVVDLNDFTADDLRTPEFNSDDVYLLADRNLGQSDQSETEIVALENAIKSSDKIEDEAGSPVESFSKDISGNELSDEVLADFETAFGTGDADEVPWGEAADNEASVTQSTEQQTEVSETDALDISELEIDSLLDDGLDAELDGFLTDDELAEIDDSLSELDAYSNDAAAELTVAAPKQSEDDAEEDHAEEEDASASDSFDDLDALLSADTISSAAENGSDLPTFIGDGAAVPEEGHDEDFGDLERLLEDGSADTTAGATTAASQRRSPQASVRRGGGLREQTMRVSVNHLDTLSNLVGELVVSRNTLERDQERLRQFLDNLLFQVQQLNDVGQRMRDLYERSLLESSLMSNRRAHDSARAVAEPQSDDPTSFFEDHATGETFDALEMDRFTGFHTLSQEMIELIVRVRESSSDIGYTVESSDQVTRQFRQITTQLQEGLNTARMVAFSQAADRLPRAVRDISMKCGKEARLIVEGQDTLVDKMIVEHLYDPLTHLVNNAITHGIETPEARRAAGKQPEGTITVRAFYQGNQTVIYVADDGGGINTDFVKKKAIEKKLVTQNEANGLSDIETYDLLFHPGFSTRDQADDFAGRGVGMDVVRTSLAEIRGTITIDSELGKGTSFTIKLPLTLSISKALSCVSNQARIAFPMDGVEDMLDVPRDRIVKNDDGQDCVRWRDMLLSFQPVTELLKFNRTLGRSRVYGGSQEDDVLSIIVLRSSNTYIAVQVDQVIGEQEIVIKQLEGPVPKPLGIAGATVLGDGRVMPIADVIELIDIAMGRVRREPASMLWSQDGVAEVEEAPVKNDPTVLIVDDSITVRELLSMSFNKVGYRVEQARDGQEAWDKLRSGLPCDLVFCDIEMPRMDGLELLSRMQKDNHLKSIPIAMLTSRGADRHRQMAVDLGASGYFTKPYLEEALLDAAQRMLNGETLAKGRGG